MQHFTLGASATAMVARHRASDARRQAQSPTIRYRHQAKAYAAAYVRRWGRPPVVLVVSR